LTSEEFQSKWQEFTNSVITTESLPSNTVSAMSRNEHADFYKHMKRYNFHSMALGGDSNSLKSTTVIRFEEFDGFCRYFFYAQPSGNLFNWYLIEMHVTVVVGEAAIIVKSDIQPDQILLQFKETLMNFV